MRLNLYNKRHDLVLGMTKVKSVVIHADRSIHLIRKLDDGSEIIMPIKSFDYDHIELRSR